MHGGESRHLRRAERVEAIGKPVCIFKMGTTFPATREQFGDFQHWTADCAGLSQSQVHVVDVEHGMPLPDHHSCGAVIMTGSHSMVTERNDWTVNTERWIARALEIEIPILGICYGHQVLASAAGGQVGRLSDGAEIGTVPVEKTAAGAEDPLFAPIPDRFPAHATHSETVHILPPDAHLLAVGNRDPHHAFRLGPNAWGVQFHPEYTADIMRSYIDHQHDTLRATGREPQDVLDAVDDTPVASGILERFVRLFYS